MAVKAEDRIKVKGYKYEKEALKEFITATNEHISEHVINAAKYRLRIIERELKILGVKE